jgi:glycosyltransferase involved in cell wall biosynthesis
MKSPLSAVGNAIWVASRFAPTYQGGLAVYSRQVIQGIQQNIPRPLRVICAAKEIDSLPTLSDYGNFPIEELKLSWIGSLTRPLWSRFASKPLLRGVLESILQRAWQRPDTDNPSVVHYVGTGWDYFGFEMAKLARHHQARFVITPAMHPGSWGSDRIDARLYRQADHVICFTKSEGSFLQQLGVSSEKISVSYLPPTCRSDGDGQRFRKSAGINNRLCVLFLGRRDEGKGYPALLKAWSLVLRAVPDAVLVLAGAAGQQYRELLAEIPASNVLDLGLPDELAKADAIAGCDIFCLPSAHESFGIVYVDAWTYGKPVICGTAPACREFIEDGKTGLWANHVPEELADKLLTLLENPNLRRTMGDAGKLDQACSFSYPGGKRSDIDSADLIESVPEPRSRGCGAMQSEQPLMRLAEADKKI